MLSYHTFHFLTTRLRLEVKGWQPNSDCGLVVSQKGLSQSGIRWAAYFHQCNPLAIELIKSEVRLIDVVMR